MFLNKADGDMVWELWLRNLFHGLSSLFKWMIFKKTQVTVSLLLFPVFLPHVKSSSLLISTGGVTVVKTLHKWPCFLTLLSRKGPCWHLLCLCLIEPYNLFSFAAWQDSGVHLMSPASTARELWQIFSIFSICMMFRSRSYSFIYSSGNFFLQPYQIISYCWQQTLNLFFSD